MMPTNPAGASRFTNPILDRDVPDPDAISLSAGGYALVASSFDRSPGLPLWRSDDLLTWHPVGFAGGHRIDAPDDGGVWAPSIREHDGRLYITWGDPDLGIFVVDAPVLEGPWSEPRLIKAGRGLIDACPHWDERGRAFIVHGYARSRAGFANRIDVFEVDAALRCAVGESRPVIEGDRIDGCTVLEGPKVYRREGELWIFAPAGGVGTGWQYAFRAPGWDGPWEHRVVLSQGATAVNGPHQGAWVVGQDGEEWFLHFQEKGWLGRVLHLQPLAWSTDGWPVVGEAVRGGAAQPVASWPMPSSASSTPLEEGDPFLAPALSPAWHARGRTREGLVVTVGDGRVRVDGDADAAVLRPVDGAVAAIEVPVLATDDAAAALVISDAEQHELLVHPPTEEGRLIEIVSGNARSSISGGASGARIGLRFADGTATFTVDGVTAGPDIVLRGRRWTGAEWGLAARGPGTAVFGAVEVEAR